jgi:hypothetical protein
MKQPGESEFRGQQDWKAQPVDVGAPKPRPLSALFTRTNPKYAQPAGNNVTDGEAPRAAPREGSMELPRATGAFRNSSPRPQSPTASDPASRISTPRAAQFASSRTEIRKPPKAPKASDMI